MAQLNILGEKKGKEKEEQEEKNGLITLLQSLIEEDLELRDDFFNFCKQLHPEALEIFTMEIGEHIETLKNIKDNQLKYREENNRKLKRKSQQFTMKY